MSVKKIYKTEDIIKIDMDDTLSVALSMLHSSHDSAFVFDENKELKGIVNPYHCFIRKSYPSNAKVKHCMYRPPKIQLNTPLHDAAKLMIHSRVHYLPVYQNQSFVGILSARRILEYVKDSPVLSQKIDISIRNKKPLITIFEDEFVSKAINLFKQYKISKIVVISRDYKLKGVLTHFDIIAYLSIPKEKKSQNRNGDKIAYTKKTVNHFMKTQVITLNSSQTLSTATHLILDKEIGSIVILDKAEHPIGIITTKDILEAISIRKSFPKLELIKQHVSDASSQLVKIFTSRLIKQSIKTRKIDRVKVLIKEEKGGKLFKAVVSFFSEDNKLYRFIEEEGHNLSRVLRKMLKKSSVR